MLRNSGSWNLQAGAGIAAKPPTTLLQLLTEFFTQHVDENLAPKTVERYHQQAAYFHQDLLSMTITEVTSLHLHREWVRLSKSGGHTRKQRTPRPLSAKTIRNIAGVVSSAFARAIRWGLVSTNPVTNSEPPRVKKHYGVALSPAQQELVLETAAGPWCMRVFSGGMRRDRRAPRRGIGAALDGHPGTGAPRLRGRFLRPNRACSSRGRNQRGRGWSSCLNPRSGC